jgi:hypothetical protein
MPEEYYEKHDMERDLGTDVEPYTEETLEELYERTGIEPGFLTELIRES